MIFFTLILINQPAFASTTSPFEQISPGVYTAKGKTNTGEGIYFALEKITAENKNHWDLYRARTDTMSNDRGMIYCFLFHSMEELEKAGFMDPKYTGFTPNELNRYLTFIHSVKTKNPKGHKVIRSVGIGTTGLNLCDDGDYFIAYISKIPVKGPRSFAGCPESGRVTLKQYLELYDDILMCVGCRLLQGMFYENRGIFRNPGSFLFGGYEGISLFLHEFTGLVMWHEFNKKFLMIRPARKMHVLLCEKLNPDEMFVDQCLDLNYGFPKPPRGFSKKNLTEEQISAIFVQQNADLKKQADIYARMKQLKNQIELHQYKLNKVKATGGQRRLKSAKTKHLSDLITELDDEIKTLNKKNRKEFTVGHALMSKTLKPGEDYRGEEQHFVRTSALVQRFISHPG